IGDKEDKTATTVFANYSRGLATARDAWAYNYSSAKLVENMNRMIDFYNTQVDAHTGGHDPVYDTTRISWNRGLLSDLKKHKRHTFESERIYRSTYRPFSVQHTYFDRPLNDMVYQLPSMLPTPHHHNIGFYVVGTGSDVPFGVLMLNGLPNLHVTG